MVKQLSSVVQWSGHRTLNPRTRVRFPAEEFLFFLNQLLSLFSNFLKSQLIELNTKEITNHQTKRFYYACIMSRMKNF